jgi:hypothetical protein
MPEPTMGQPFIPYPGLRISVGDLFAAPGTAAYWGVIIIDPNAPVNVPSHYIISPIGPFQVQAQIRTVLAGADFFLPDTLVTQFIIQNILTGAPAGTFTGQPPVTMAQPAGDHGLDGPFDTGHLEWFAINSPMIPALPAGLYRILVVGHDGDVLFFNEDTIILVR